MRSTILTHRGTGILLSWCNWCNNSKIRMKAGHQVSATSLGALVMVMCGAAPSLYHDDNTPSRYGIVIVIYAVWPRAATTRFEAKLAAMRHSADQQNLVQAKVRDLYMAPAPYGSAPSLCMAIWPFVPLIPRPAFRISHQTFLELMTHVTLHLYYGVLQLLSPS